MDDVDQKESRKETRDSSPPTSQTGLSNVARAEVKASSSTGSNVNTVVTVASEPDKARASGAVLQPTRQPAAGGKVVPTSTGAYGWQGAEGPQNGVEFEQVWSRVGEARRAELLEVGFDVC